MSSFLIALDSDIESLTVTDVLSGRTVDIQRLISSPTQSSALIGVGQKVARFGHQRELRGGKEALARPLCQTTQLFSHR